MNPESKYMKHRVGILCVIFIPICLSVFAVYGWTFLPVVMNRPGLRGGMYTYFDLSKRVYAGYLLITTLYAALVCAISVKSLLITTDRRAFSNACWQFLFLIAWLIICESILEFRFVGKG
jgi:hypothetical protein